jgi:L-asparaginase II
MSRAAPSGVRPWPWPERPRLGAEYAAAVGPEPIRVEVRRGDVVESVREVAAVALRQGRIVAAAGDPGLVTFMRSAAKPLQALPLARAREDLDDRELAIACASHLARPDQLEAVRSLLAKADATEDDLECGAEGNPPSRLRHNCSGKHAGMLALCRARGWPIEGYRLAGHPVQQACAAALAEAAEVARESLLTAVDGCGVVTFALPLEAMARAFSRLEQLEAGERVAAAMRAHPELIRGDGAPDTELMRAHSGWIAKGGAEAVLCAAADDGLGIALKVADGGYRAVGPALAAFLGPLGFDLPAFVRTPMRNSRNEVVGEVAAAPVRSPEIALEIAPGSD